VIATSRPGVGNDLRSGVLLFSDLRPPDVRGPLSSSLSYGRYGVEELEWGLGLNKEHFQIEPTSLKKSRLVPISAAGLQGEETLVHRLSYITHYIKNKQ
jgi:hypothetical protein